MAETSMVPLAAAIANLRSELLAAVAEGHGKALQFRLKPVELTLNVAVTKDYEGNAGVKFWVLDIGAKGSLETAVTHEIKLTLEPVGPDGKGDYLISNLVDEEPG